MKILNLGCGFCNREPGEFGVDNDPKCKPDLLWDLNETPWPLPGNSFDEIRAIHLLEHIPNIIGVMNESWEVLKRGGLFLIRVPLFPTLGAIADPTHVRYFIPQTFDYFTRKGKLTGLKHIFKIVNIRVAPLTPDTNEIQCQLRK